MRHAPFCTTITAQLSLLFEWKTLVSQVKKMTVSSAQAGRVLHDNPAA